MVQRVVFFTTVDHFLRPGVSYLLVLLLVHIHQLADVVGVAQAVRAKGTNWYWSRCTAMALTLAP